MRKEPERIKLFCPQCRRKGGWGATSWFILVDGRYVCAGDPKEKRNGCGKVIERE